MQTPEIKYLESNDWMTGNDEIEGMGKKAVVA
jgi:hypothetical protein